jgi:hypothetical protein
MEVHCAQRSRPTTPQKREMRLGRERPVRAGSAASFTVSVCSRFPCSVSVLADTVVADKVKLRSKPVKLLRPKPDRSGICCWALRSRRFRQASADFPRRQQGALILADLGAVAPIRPSARVVGRPNACNLCHLAKSLGWTAAQLKRLYNIDSPELSDDFKNIELSLLLGVRGDAGQRALIAGAIDWPAAQRASGHGVLTPLLCVLMDDPYDAVRCMAGRALESLPDVDSSALHYAAVPPQDARLPFAPPRRAAEQSYAPTGRAGGADD